MSAATPERLRVFIDSDVLFAGAASVSGASHLVLQLAELGIVQAFVSQQMRTEVERNLGAKLPAALPALRALIEACCTTLADSHPEQVRQVAEQQLADPKDAPILAAALDSGCAWLLTFNVRDFRAGDRISVDVPGEFVNRLRHNLLSLAEPPPRQPAP